MGMRPTFEKEDGDNNTPLVDKRIGDAYPIVKKVHDNLDVINKVSSEVDTLPTLVQDTVNTAVANAMPAVRTELQGYVDQGEDSAADSLAASVAAQGHAASAAVSLNASEAIEAGLPALAQSSVNTNLAAAMIPVTAQLEASVDEAHDSEVAAASSLSQVQTIAAGLPAVAQTSVDNAVTAAMVPVRVELQVSVDAAALSAANAASYYASMQIPTLVTVNTAPVQFSDIGKFGGKNVTWRPAGGTSVAVVAAEWVQYFVDSSEGNIAGVAHGIGDFVRLELKGGNTITQSYAREVRIGVKDGTTVGTVYGETYVLENTADSSGVLNNVVIHHLPDMTGQVTHFTSLTSQFLDPRFRMINKGTFETGNGELAPPPSMMHTGRWYTSMGATSQAPGAIQNGLLMCAPPIHVAKKTTITKLFFEVTAAVAGSSARVGLYKAGTNGMPDALVVSSGAVATTTTGGKTAAVNVTLDAGLYYPVLLVAGGATNISIKQVVINPAVLLQLYGGNAGDPFASAPEDTIYTVPGGTTLPASFGAPTRLLVGTVPLISIST